MKGRSIEVANHLAVKLLKARHSKVRMIHEQLFDEVSCVMTKDIPRTASSMYLFSCSAWAFLKVLLND
jgi:hypothetical protein